jgi:hypothetical protein
MPPVCFRLWIFREVARLNTDNINKWLTLVANLAVVAGIVFVALELNQNSRMMKTQTRNAITESILGFQFDGVETGLRDLATRGNANPSALTAEESQKLLQFYVSNFRLWENIHYQYRNGVFDEEEFDAERNSWEALGERTPIMHLVYCGLRQRQSLSPAFIAEMDALGYGAPGKCDLQITGIVSPAAPAR